jgi:OOP family OmpA-OmpF porin
VADYLDKCPDTPKGVKVDANGCPIDSDGDGVPDSLDKCPDTPKGVKVDANGCPIIEKTAEQIESEKMKVEPIYFDTNKSDITAQEKVKIDKLVGLLIENSNYKVKVYGYADAIGSDAYNLVLSRNRVSSVVKSILSGSNKIKKNRIEQQKGFGEANPAATNDTPEGRALNRRVEFEITKK